MRTRPLHLLPAAVMAGCLSVCAAFVLFHLGLRLYPDGMESWLADNQWLMWTAAALTVASALSVPLLSLIGRQQEERR